MSRLQLEHINMSISFSFILAEVETRRNNCHCWDVSDDDRNGKKTTIIIFDNIEKLPDELKGYVKIRIDIDPDWSPSTLPHQPHENLKYILKRK